MNFETWAVFFVAYLIVTLSPGPNVILVIKNAIKYGYKVASITILLNLFCQFLIITSVAFGAGALLEKSPTLFFILKLIGGGYLIYLGILGLFNESKAVELRKLEVSVPKHFSYYKICKEAFFVSASNPKTVIFLSAFLPQFISVNESVFLQFTEMFLTICMIVVFVHLSYSYVAKNINNRFATLKGNSLVSKITNSAFVVFGCGVLSSFRAT